MISPRYFFNRLKDVKASDLAAVFPMLGALIVSPLFKKKYSHTWLICEEKAEARDNGYWFFRKMREEHPKQPCIYAIDKKSVDYKKVKDLGQVIQYGSFLHWVIYFTCERNISSQKGGKPNAVLCAFIELNNWYNAHNIFLQHGVIINDLRWLYADRSRFDMFVTSAVPETKYIEEKGWGKSVVERPDYFFLDDSYIRILLEYGIIVFVVVMAILIIVSRRAAYAGRMTMVFAIAFISLHSFMEHHLLDIAYNPFILCVFADLSIKKEKKECMILNKR